MTYPFLNFVQHSEAWQEAGLAETVVLNGETIALGKQTDVYAIVLRVRAMFSRFHCTPEEAMYWAPRFHRIIDYLALHLDAFVDEGLALINDEGGRLLTLAAQKAVLEAFDRDPLPGLAQIDLPAVLARGRELQATEFKA